MSEARLSPELGRITPSQPVTRPSLPPRALGLRHRLVVWSADNAEARALPRVGSVVLGRGADVQVRIDAPSISRRHAELLIQDGRVAIRDLGSQNGTRINGERIADQRPLSYGDVITLGEVFVIFSEQPPGESIGRDGTPGPEAIERTMTLGDTTVLVADPSMGHVYAQIERLAATDLSVLIWGETGTGKELAATALHLWSNRAAGPFVAINCAALPDGLAESELFGHVRGAFSGAVADKPGLLETAVGGTVFLDEIGDLSLSIQSKLLRVLETRAVTRLGAVQERKIDVRVVAASHRRIDLGAKEGWFREDLYYRLNVAFLSLPPLRARPRELARLAERFLNGARMALGHPTLTIAPAALQRLMTHSWPGNIRELKNMMEYLAVTHRGAAVDLDVVAAVLENSGATAVRESAAKLAAALALAPAIPTPVSSPEPPLPSVPPSPVSLADSNREHERKRLQAAIDLTGGNKTRAAKLLGVPLRTFMTKVKKHGL
ncbi:MAG TPA: sigma 54-interacting transcriptional regulator [Polyangia bacterium]|jgi:DNA-binding NtrC family response regulator